MRSPPKTIFWLALGLGVVLGIPSAYAHHILGRPAYNLSEDSNTPPSMQVETQIGDYFVTFMAFPAFPRPGEPGRVHLYARHLDTGEPYRGEVRFSVRDDIWIGGEDQQLGVQGPDDNVYRQGFVISEEGNYIVRATFEAGGAPYVIDFPLTVGDPRPVAPVVIAVGTIVLVLVWVNLARRRKRKRRPVRGTRAEPQIGPRVGH